MPISEQVKEYMSRASWIRRMFEQGNELKAEFGAQNVFDFTLGNPEMEPPAALTDKLRELTAEPEPGMHRYMPNAGYPWVRERVAAALATESGVSVTGGHVIMTVGAACALNITLKALLDPGDEVLVLAPYFVEYLFYVENHRGKPKVLSTNDDFLPDLEAIGAAIGPRTKALIINSPNNPTGVVYPRTLLQSLASVLEEASERVGHPIYLLSDEPYRKISYGEPVTPTLSIYPHTVLCTSHSKDLALPGERIGTAVVHPEAADAEQLVGAMTFAIRTLGFVNAPALWQRAVADLQDVTVDVDKYQRKRELLYQGLTDAGYECVLPGGAFYMFPRSPIDDDVKFVGLLQQERILAVPGRGFGCPGYFRLAYCIQDDVIERALPGLKRVFEAC